MYNSNCSNFVKQVDKTKTIHFIKNAKPFLSLLQSESTQLFKETFFWY